jgi:hypothetical protein
VAAPVPPNRRRPSMFKEALSALKVVERAALKVVELLALKVV